VEVVKVLLEIAFAAETNRVVVEEAHGALVLLVHRHDRARRWMRSDVESRQRRSNGHRRVKPCLIIGGNLADLGLRNRRSNVA
jgi:hypothetical protein